MINSPVTLFWRRSRLDQTVERLRQHGYQVVELDASGWAGKAEMLTEIGAALGFPDFQGRSLDAFVDHMRDVVTQQHGWRPDAAGLVIVLIRYDAIAERDPHAAHAVLDTMADQSRTALLFGRRLMCLVQSDDPDIHFGPIGAMSAMWNDAEVLPSKRS
jgi:hypothetical protein